MKVFPEKGLRKVSYHKAEHRKIIDAAIDQKLQLTQFNSPRVLKYKQQAFQNQQNSLIGFNQSPMQKTQQDGKIAQELKILNGPNIQGHGRAQSIYDQLLTTLNQKQEKQANSQQQHQRTVSQMKQSKSNVMLIQIPENINTTNNSLAQFVTKVNNVNNEEPTLSKRSANKSNNVSHNSDIYVPRLIQTDKNVTSTNKHFQFPQGSSNFAKQLLKKSLPSSIRSNNTSKELIIKESPTKVSRSSDQSNKVQRYYLSKVEAAFKSPNMFDVINKLIRDHFVQTFQGLNFTKSFKAQKPHEKKKYNLIKAPYYKDKITVVFDLDETLVHCNDSATAPHDVLLSIQINPQTMIKAGINVRPYARQILANLKDDFEIIVFTASHNCYAQKVIEHLDPDGTKIQHRLFREHCTLTTSNLYVKDLQVLCDEHRPLSRVVLVDNAAYSYGWQPENGIPIIPYYDNRADKELQDLEVYLRGMLGIKDVREYNREQLKLHSMVENRGPQKAFQNIFGYEI